MTTKTERALESFQKIADNINYMNAEYQQHYMRVKTALQQNEKLVSALKNCAKEFAKINDCNMAYEIDMVVAEYEKGEKPTYPQES